MGIWLPIFGSPLFLPQYNTQVVALISGFFRGLKAQIDEGSAAIFTDLRSSDIAWFLVANAAMQAQLPRPGEFGPGVMASFLDTGIYRLHSVVGLGLQHITAALPEIISKQQVFVKVPALMLTASYDFGREAPLTMMAHSPREGASMLETELASLRVEK